MLSLIHSVKSHPVPVLTVTRAMNAQSDLANKVADALHIAEGAKPIPLDEIPDVTVADDTIETVPMEADSLLDFTEAVILTSMEMATSYPFAVPLRNYTS